LRGVVSLAHVGGNASAVGNLHPDFGAVWWPGPTDAVGLAKGAYDSDR
jgi:hypothetical protein